MSGHWRGSESLSGSGELQGISKITGGRSSRRMREVEAASGGSGPIEQEPGVIYFLEATRCLSGISGKLIL